MIDHSKIKVWEGAINYFPHALMEVARVSQGGAEKHGVTMADPSWPDEPVEHHTNALTRHLVSLSEGEINEEDGGVYHRAQLAWRALASLEIVLGRVANDGNGDGANSPRS
jgi:hypothetical protein